jgi:hypothetical protein
MGAADEQRKVGQCGTLDPLAVPTSVVPWDEAAEAWLEPATKLVVDRS